MIIPLAVALVSVAGGSLSGVPNQDDAEDIFLPLPPREVAAGRFEQHQRESEKTPSVTTTTRVEYDGRTFWVAKAQCGFGAPSTRIAVYAPTKAGSFRRCLLAGPFQGGMLVAAVDAKTGVLSVREEANSSLKGEVVLSCNLKAVGALP